MDDMTPMMPPAPADAPDDDKATPQQVNLLQKLVKTIKSDKDFHEKAFKRMRRDMGMAFKGYDVDDWSDAQYSVNIAGRHVKQKTAALYAKNPTATATRRDTLDFRIWDENPDTLKLAFSTVQMAQQVQAQNAANAAAVTGADGGMPLDPSALPGGQPGAPPPMPAGPPDIPQAPGNPNYAPPGTIEDGALAAQAAGAHRSVAQLAIQPPTLPMPPGFVEAQDLLNDFQQGMERRTQIKKFGRTLEIIFAQAMREQKPVDFKKGMKQLVRRTCTTGVGYLELNFQREYGPSPAVEAQLTDQRSRLAHLQHLAEDVADGEIESTDAEMAELEASIADLQQQPQVIMREGLVFDYPQSTKVIPDRLTKQIEGFVGARHLTIEYLYTEDEVEETFGVDLKGQYRGYGATDKNDDSDNAQMEMPLDENGSNTPKPKGGLVCVWKHYDKPSGLVYYIAEGYKDGFLREPAAPDVFVDDFWPVYTLTFNAVEHEKELFPPSDVTLLLHMQKEYNRARQGQSEHRKAARPRWVAGRGILDENDQDVLRDLNPFEVGFVNLPQDADIRKVLQVLPVPGVDPNLYETNMLFTDTQLAVGTQAAQFGGLSKATATESAISANSSNSSDGSSIDDLDAFLSTVTRAASMILMREMSPEKVMEIVGPGGVWPDQTDAQIADEIFLEVAAGSTGKPNQAVEINNWKQMLPFLLQMGTIQPIWLARETLRRLDDKLDLTDALAAGIPAIVAQNRAGDPFSAQAPTPGEPPPAPGGAANGPAPPGGQGGSGPHFGSNQV